MASFQAKIVWKRPRKRENRNYCFITFLPNALQKILKKQQKNEKIIPLWLNFNSKSVERGREREKIKIIVSFRPYLTNNRKFQKNCKIIQKIKKCQYGFI